MSLNTPRIRMIVAAGALALAAAIPTAAQAATISWEGDALVYRAAPGEKNSTGPGEATINPDKTISISDNGVGVQITNTTDHCVYTGYWYECDVPARMVIDTGDGDDFVTFGGTAEIPYEVYAGDGADEVRGFRSATTGFDQLIDGGPGSDKLDGDIGKDVVRGGLGDDEVTGGSGNDTVEGGDGNDTLYPDGYDEPGTDVVDGGAGFDLVSDYVIPGNDFNPAIAISYDGVANDGRPGENDNLTNVEKLESSVSGTFVGGPGADEFFVKADFNDAVSTIKGLGGDDKLKGHDHVEDIDGGPGNDIIEGGLNNDTITGGPGKDTIFGDSAADTCNFLHCRIAFGNDVIDARDGEVDTIDCGVGEDKAIVDAIDVVANCEDVSKQGGSNGPGGKESGDTLNGPKRYTRKALKKGIAVAWDCTAACTVKLTLVADKKTAKRLGTKLIASGKGSIAQAGKVKFRAKLTKKARKHVSRLRKGAGTIVLALNEGGTAKRYTQSVKLKK